MALTELIALEIPQRGHPPVGADGLPRASEGPLFQDGFFGRDAITVAMHELEIDPQIARNTILALAKLQGTKFNVVTEEEPGKIHHEYRSLYNPDGSIVSPSSQSIFVNLKENWGNDQTGDPNEFIYYGTADATPSYIILLDNYIAQTGDRDILSEEITQRNGERITILQSALRAAEYIQTKINHSEQTRGINLYGFQKINPQGLHFQSWLDGSISYMHPTGELANENDTIYDTALQGLAYDALFAAANLLEPHSLLAQSFKEMAVKIQKQTIELLWMPEQNYFAMGLDFDPQTQSIRQIQALHANVAELLKTHIFDSLPEDEKRKYIHAIITTIMSDEFLTEAGVRCRALCHRNIATIDGIRVTGYQSSETSWFKQTADIAEGLRQQGFNQLARHLFIRVINTIRTIGTREYIYVLADGSLAYELEEVPFSNELDDAVLIATNIPEQGQAWTESAYDLALLRLSQTPDNSLDSWQEALDQYHARQIPPVFEYSLDEIHAIRRQSRPAKICLQAGRFYEQQIIEGNRIV